MLIEFNKLKAEARSNAVDQMKNLSLIVPCRIKLQLASSHSSEEFEKLTHFRVGPLFNESILMDQCIELFTTFLSSSEHQISSAISLFVGLDSWGAWLAAEVGARCRVRSVGVSLRGCDDESVLFELQRRSPLNLAKGFSNIVFFTDVVITGSTLSRARRLLEIAIGGNPPADRASSPKVFKSLFCTLIRAKIPHAVEVHTPLSSEFAGAPRCCVVEDIPVPVVAKSALPETSLFPRTELYAGAAGVKHWRFA